MIKGTYENRRCFQRPLVGKHQVVVRFSFFIITQTVVMLKILLYFDQRRVKLKILVISFFPSAVVLERESSESL